MPSETPGDAEPGKSDKPIILMGHEEDYPITYAGKPCVVKIGWGPLQSYEAELYGKVGAHPHLLPIYGASTLPFQAVGAS